MKPRLHRPLLAAASLAAFVLACAGWAVRPAPGPGARTPTAEAAEGGLSLTVYNQGTALVRDRRQVQLTQGANELRFGDVAASIDPTSVLFSSLTDPAGTFVLEQNYEFDLVGSAALLEKYLDEQITVVTQDGTLYAGKLLSGRGDIILEDDDGRVTVVRADDIQEFSFPELPEGLITRPTLVWRLMAQKAGAQDVEITYLTGGISWQADYVLLLGADERSLDLDGWVTVSNTSGATFGDALLKLIAGDLNRLPQAGLDVMEEQLRAMATQTPAAVEQREFFEYHLYEIPRPVTVRDNETKQIEFVSAQGIGAAKFFVYDGQQCQSYYWYCAYSGYPQIEPTYGVVSNPKVLVMVEFDTDDVEADLPRGRVRLYQEDIDGAALLIGESQIDHTPKGEQLRLYTGDAFDIVGERIQTDFRRPSEHSLEETYEITLRNHKDEAVEVRVVEHLFRWSEWRILNASDGYEKMDSSTIEFRVNVPAEGETTVTYTVRYSWP
ncbi:MAG TPA: hypothetical protein VFI11_06355 [Anaerolineales bacterium]|nr:hypothetical protein [Anaerolineales bacterium]